MNKTLDDIILSYTSGKKTAEETNEALEKGRFDIRIDPMHNKLTAEKIDAGYGLLDTGTGTLDVVQVRNGKLVNADVGESYALVWLKNKMYHVKPDGVTLCD